MTNRSTSAPLADRPAADMADGGQDPLSRTGQQAGDSVGHLAERAGDLGFKQADQGRTMAADRLDTLADSIRKVSTDMQGEQPTMANVAATAADQTERVASYLRDTDAREMLGTVEDLARRQPILFLGGAFLLGMAASRFMKAAGGGGTSGGMHRGAGRSYQSGYGTRYGAGYGTDYRSGVTGDYRATGPGASTDVTPTGGSADEGL